MARTKQLKDNKGAYSPLVHQSSIVDDDGNLATFGMSEKDVKKIIASKADKSELESANAKLASKADKIELASKADKIELERFKSVLESLLPTPDVNLPITVSTLSGNRIKLGVELYEFLTQHPEFQLLVTFYSSNNTNERTYTFIFDDANKRYKAGYEDYVKHDAEFVCIYESNEIGNSGMRDVVITKFKWKI